MLNVRDQRQICFYFNSGLDARSRTHMLKTSDKVAFSELNMKKNSILLTSSTEEEEKTEATHKSLQPVRLAHCVEHLEIPL